MDTRTGTLYPTMKAALEAGVPRRAAAEVEHLRGVRDVVRITNGPFKGRVYERLPGGGLKRLTGNALAAALAE